MLKTISFVIKVAISVLLLYYSVNVVNFAAVKDRLLQSDVKWLALEVATVVAQTVVIAVRWRTILTYCGSHLPFSDVVRFNLISSFFGQLLPSSIGGDGVRVWLVGRRGDWRGGAYSTLLDRVVGIIGLAVLVLLCLPWSLSLIADRSGRIALIIFGFGSIFAGVVFLLFSLENLRILQHLAITRHLAAVAKVGLKITQSPPAFAAIILLSVLNHLMIAFAAWCGARAIGADISLFYAVLLIPPVMLVTVLPISIAGWGLRESAMVAAFSYIGLPAIDGLIVSLLLGLSYLALGAIGSLVWITTPGRTQTPLKQGS